MASTIQIKNSTTASNSPTTLTTGELAINVVDGNFFYGSGSAVKQDFAFTSITASAISSSGALIGNTLTAAGIAYPTADGDNGDVLITDGAGNLSFTRTTVYANVKNVHGSELIKGMPVHVTGAAGNTSEVVAASASNAATMPAHFILNETLADDAEGLAIAVGYINGVNTGDFNEGDTVYVGANGGYTNVKPTGSNLIQNLGIVDKVDASNGSGFILGAGRSNDVPNISPGYAWVGNSDQVATAVATSSFVVTNANTASYVQAANIDGTIDISDQTNLAGGTNLTLSGDTMNLDANISLTTITASNDVTTEGSLITTKTGSVTDPALLIGVNSGYLAGNNTGIILEDLVPGTNFFVPYFVSNGAKIFGFGTVMTMEKNLDMKTNRIYFDSDSTNTYIAANTDDPEDLEIHADQDIILNPDGQVIANSNISASGTITANSFVGTVTTATTASYVAVANIDGAIDISDQTNLAGGTNLTLSDDTMNLDADISLTSVTSSVILTDTRHLPNTDGSDQYYGDVVKFGGGGVLTQGSIYYLDSSQNWQLADASAASTAQGMLGIATSTGIELLVKGIARHGGWAGLGHGSVIYLSETAGELTITKPTTSGAIVRVIGYCTNTTTREIYFNPSTDWIELA